MRFLIVDVFTTQKYAGNQLAVVLDGGALSTDAMQQIALEMNYSETTFLLAEKEREGAFDVRIFTPRAEVPFAGHPTLGTAHVLQTEVLDVPHDRIVLRYPVGEVPVDIERQVDGETRYWMTQPVPTYGPTVPAAQAAEVLGLGPSDLDTRFPAQVVSTGLPHLVVPLPDLATLRRVRLADGPYNEVAEHIGVDLVLAFCPETRHPDHDFSVRVFAPSLGVAEDPATGSGNGCLAAYLSHHAYGGSPSVAATNEQGDEVSRPSLLHIRATPEADTPRIEVGGGVVSIARGTLL